MYQQNNTKYVKQISKNMTIEEKAHNTTFRTIEDNVKHKD